MEHALLPAVIDVGWVGLGAGIIALLLCILAVCHRCRQRNRMLRSLIESFEQPLLFYNEYGRLEFYSSGLILFDKKTSLSRLRHPPAQPTRNQTHVGEMEIDHNRYRFTCRIFEYKPETFGTLVRLEYTGKAPANR